MRSMNGLHGDLQSDDCSALMKRRRRDDFRQSAVSRLHKPLEAGAMRTAQMRRNDCFEGLSDCFQFRIAEQLFGIFAPIEDLAGGVNRECWRSHFSSSQWSFYLLTGQQHVCPAPLGHGESPPNSCRTAALPLCPGVPASNGHFPPALIESPAFQ